MKNVIKKSILFDLDVFPKSLGGKFINKFYYVSYNPFVSNEYYVALNRSNRENIYNKK